jgi:hypothetical protein
MSQAYASHIYLMKGLGLGAASGPREAVKTSGNFLSHLKVLDRDSNPQPHSLQSRPLPLRHRGH